MKGFVLASACLVLLSACGQPGGSGPAADLAINHASILDVRTGRVERDRLILMRAGMIASISRAEGSPRARRVIDARGRLVTPGFVDAHSHLCSIFCAPGTDTLPSALISDPRGAHRRALGAQYLPHGVTAVRDVGTEERALPFLRAMLERSADSPDFYPVGAHLISPQSSGRHAPWQVVVADSAAAARKVREYHELGLRHIKLYWRLREPEFRGALQEARRLGMNVTGHVDQGVMRIDRALDLGLPSVEHVHTFGYSVLTRADFDSLVAQVPRTLGIRPPAYPPTALFMNVPEIFNYLGPADPRLLALVAQFKATGASLTPTLHVFAQRYGLTYFTSAPSDSTEDTSVWTTQQRERTRAGYRVMASYVRRLHDAGVRLTVGTDSRDPGKGVLSEMLLLHDAGIDMADVFRIATLDTATSIGQEAEHGSIEVGKRANLVVFDGDPLTRPAELLGKKTVVKDGHVVVE